MIMYGQLLLSLAITIHVSLNGVNGMKPFHFVGSKDTQHNRFSNDSLYYTTNSNLPLTPFVTGFVGSAGTYRFLVVATQTVTMIGEAKHGLWRLQENGYIREYRKKERPGLPPTLNPNSATTLMDNGHKDTILHNYGHFLEGEGSSGYKYPDQKISDGSDGIAGHLNFIDLSIYHSKYGGKYNDHVPIDLPYWYCILSGTDFQHMKRTWQYVSAQPNANKVGPLGKRAGFDIKENFENLIRLDMFGDAGLWANVGHSDPTKSYKTKNLNDVRDRVQFVDYQRVKMDTLKHEVYLFERIFFNEPYLYIGIVMDNELTPSPNSDFSYVRPDGAYHDELSKRRDMSGFNNVTKFDTYVNFENFPNKGEVTKQKTVGLPLYGMQHPNRFARQMNGGACPEKGGDIGRYPWGNPGAGWPTNHEEVTPICDAFAIDLKLWGNLDKTWNDPSLFTGSSGFQGQTKVDYLLDPNVYGKFENPYLKDKVNPHATDFTVNGEQVSHKDEVRKPNPISLSMDFSRLGKVLDFNNVSSIHEVDIESPVDPVNKECKTKAETRIVVEEKKCDYESNLLIVITVGVILIFMLNMCALGYFCTQAGRNRGGKQVEGRDNEGAA